MIASAFPAPRLLAISPGDGRPLDPWVDALGAAGWPAVLLREKADHAQRWREAAARAAALGLTVFVHAECPGARADPGPWPLHLPSAGPAHPAARGQSCHSAAAIAAAFARGCSYALLSPVWAPTSKPGDTRPTLGIAGFCAAAGPRPVLALGGVDAPRLAALANAGAWGAAVLGPLCGAEPARAAALLLDAWSTGRA